MKIELQREFYSEEQCNKNPNNLYVFGDNTFRSGKKGQAQIRDCKNSFGIVTKWAPNTSEGAYFKDFENCATLIEDDIDRLVKEKDKWDKIIFPYDGLGTGLSELPKRAPLLYKILCYKLFIHFGVKYINI